MDRVACLEARRDDDAADGCKSAWGPEADWHDKLLICLAFKGSFFGADLQLELAGFIKPLWRYVWEHRSRPSLDELSDPELLAIRKLDHHRDASCGSRV
jgi:hypothetical protein